MLYRVVKSEICMHDFFDENLNLWRIPFLFNNSCLVDIFFSLIFLSSIAYSSVHGIAGVSLYIPCRARAASSPARDEYPYEMFLLINIIISYLQAVVPIRRWAGLIQWLVYTTIESLWHVCDHRPWGNGRTSRPYYTVYYI